MSEKETGSKEGEREEGGREGRWEVEWKEVE